MSESPTKKSRVELRDARLHLLDRQLLDDNGDPVGIVDDVVLTGIELDREIPAGEDVPRVSGLLSGKVVVNRIVGGTPPPSRLQEIPWELVASIGVVVTLRPSDVTFDASWLEGWLRNYVIKHIPGGRHAAE
jgi:hypothetical protein